MADQDLITSVITHGGAVAGGGGLAAWFVRAMFSGVVQRLDKIEAAIERGAEKTDKRHDDLVAQLAEVKLMAAKAHSRIDAIDGSARRRK